MPGLGSNDSTSSNSLNRWSSFSEGIPHPSSATRISAAVRWGTRKPCGSKKVEQRTVMEFEAYFTDRRSVGQVSGYLIHEIDIQELAVRFWTIVWIFFASPTTFLGLWSSSSLKLTLRRSASALYISVACSMVWRRSNGSWNEVSFPISSRVKSYAPSKPNDVGTRWCDSQVDHWL